MSWSCPILANMPAAVASLSSARSFSLSLSVLVASLAKGGNRGSDIDT